jgi:hypothetical protein
LPAGARRHGQAAVDGRRHGPRRRQHPVGAGWGRRRVLRRRLRLLIWRARARSSQPHPASPRRLRSRGERASRR